MTETLQVTLEGARLNESDEMELQATYRVAVAGVVSPSIAASTSFILRKESYGVALEPFVGGASLQALTTVAKKRAVASDVLSKLVACSFLFSERVGVLHHRDGSELPREREEIALASVRGRRLSPNVWYRIAVSTRWFRFERVEATLLRPLTLANGEVATHYLRDFWVRAAEQEVAKAVVASNVAQDTALVVDVGTITNDAPPPSGADGERIIRSGRVYFRDRRAHSVG